MHPSLLPLLLPTLLLPLTTTAQQIPLASRAKGWFSAAKSAIPTSIPPLPGLTPLSAIPTPLASPISVSASQIASTAITPLNMSNWQSFLSAPTAGAIGPLEYMVYVTGGNKTCPGGLCHNLDVAFNETAAILAADPTAPKLGILNCDNAKALCATWSAKPPTIWHVRRFGSVGEKGGQRNEIRVNFLNFTETRVGDMVSLHTGNKYEEGWEYEGVFHLFDGWLARHGLLNPVGYVLWGLGVVPSWVVMLVISLGSRAFITRRYAPDQTRARAQAAMGQGGQGGQAAQ